jgi:multiple sugar transport system permease protein
MRRSLEGYLFAAPWILGFLIWQLGPFLASMWFSLNRWDILTPMRFLGLANYSRMVNDALFWQSFTVTVTYIILSLPLQLALALLIAVVVNKEWPGMLFFRGVFFLPSVTAGVATAVLWRWLLNPEYGLINYFLSLVGIKGPLWLQSETWALPGLILMSLWGIGSTMLIYLAALQGVPAHLYEAAEIDGASLSRRFWHITLPIISPAILFTLIMGVIGSFQVFTQAYVMTNGGPRYATLFYVLYLYQEAFRALRMGYASALAWVLFIIIMVVTLLQFRAAGRWVYYEAKD